MRGDVTVVELLGFAATIAVTAAVGVIHARRRRAEFWGAEAWRLGRREWWRRVLWDEGIDRPPRDWRTLAGDLAWGFPIFALIAISALWALTLYHRLIWGSPN